VTPWLTALAVAVVAGGIVAVSAREARVAILGLTICGVTAPLLADPPPGPLPLAARLLAAILAGYLLWISARQRPLTRGSRLGWPVEALLAAAAAVAGLGAAGFAGPAGGPPEAEAAAFALGALAVGPILRGADVFRLAIGLLLAVLGAGVGRVALAGTAVPLDQLVIAGLTIVLAAAVGTIARGEARLGAGVQPSTLRPPPGRVQPSPRPMLGVEPRMTTATARPVEPPRPVDASRPLDAPRPTRRGFTAALAIVAASTIGRVRSGRR
jgi:hypothetical protein